MRCFVLIAPVAFKREQDYASSSFLQADRGHRAVAERSPTWQRNRKVRGIAVLGGPATPMDFIPHGVYRRRDIHASFGGQGQGGISTPADHPIVFLFTSESGRRHGYEDKWSGDGLFFYTGEGQIGDMTFVRGNAAVRDHTTNGKDLLLFEYIGRGLVRYVGQMVCVGYHERRGRDRSGRERTVIVFELSLLSDLAAADKSNDEQLSALSLEALRQRAIAASAPEKTPAGRKRNVWKRSQIIRLYVLERANGNCEGCGARAPFLTQEREPYLEPHHIRRLSDGGPDDPRWMVAVCPNCHRRAHYSADAEPFNRSLVERLKYIESAV